MDIWNEIYLGRKKTLEEIEKYQFQRNIADTILFWNILKGTANR